MPTIKTERRVRPRVTYAREVVVTRAGERFSCQGRNLSSTGLGLLCPSSGLPGGLVHLEVTLVPGQPSLQLDGIQVREERSARGSVWGVRFHRPEPRATAMLMAHVRGEVIRANLEATRGKPAKITAIRSGIRAIRDLYRAAMHSLE